MRLREFMAHSVLARLFDDSLKFFNSGSCKFLANVITEILLMAIAVPSVDTSRVFKSRKKEKCFRMVWSGRVDHVRFEEALISSRSLRALLEVVVTKTKFSCCPFEKSGCS